MPRRIILTGVTGLVGGAIFREWLHESRPDDVIMLILRRGTHATSRERFEKTLSSWLPWDERIRTSTLTYEFFDGDLTRASTWWDSLVREFQPSHCVHVAASTRFDQTLNEAWEQNVAPVKAMVAGLEKVAPQCKFVFLSTAFVSGSKKGPVLAELRRGENFRNHYERGKWIAERVIADSKLPWTILRPSIVVGDSRNGYTPHFRVFYTLLKISVQGYLWRNPCSPRSEIDCVPVDYVARATAKVCDSTTAERRVLHLCAGGSQMSARSLMSMTEKNLGIALPKVYPVWCVQLLFQGPWSKLLPTRWQDLWGMFKTYIPYMTRQGQIFETRSSEECLQMKAPVFAVYGGNILQFCKNKRGGIILR